MRKFALLVSVCTTLLFTHLAAAQQVDIMFSGSTLATPAKPTDQVNFQQPVEKGGTYVGISGDYIGIRKRRIGINVETAWRYRQAPYPYNGETYRPFFTDANALFQPPLTKVLGRQVGLEFMAGAGVASTRFNLPSSTSCGLVGGGCVNYNSSNHFMEDLGAGIRYRLWRRFFVRGDVRYYHIQNNIEFSSDNVFRIGATVGYSFGPK